MRRCKVQNGNSISILMWDTVGGLPGYRYTMNVSPSGHKVIHDVISQETGMKGNYVIELTALKCEYISCGRNSVS